MYNGYTTGIQRIYNGYRTDMHRRKALATPCHPACITVAKRLAGATGLGAIPTSEGTPPHAGSCGQARAGKAIRLAIARLPNPGSHRVSTATNSSRKSQPTSLGTAVVTQTSKSAVSQVSKPANHPFAGSSRLGSRRYTRFGDLRHKQPPPLDERHYQAAPKSSPV
jgi:hypothetical protein